MSRMCLATALLLTAAKARAQVVGGSIGGTVTDVDEFPRQDGDWRSAADSVEFRYAF